MTELRSEDEWELIRQIGSDVPSRQEEQRVSGRRQNGTPEEVEESQLWKSRKSRESQEECGLRGSWGDRQKLHTLGSSRSWY